VFYWTCITVYQYRETNVMHSFTQFRVLLAHPQEALHNGTWYIACVLCQLAAPGLKRNSNPGAGNWQLYYQYSKTKKIHFLYSIYYELTASTCFEYYLLIFRRCCTNNAWYTAWVLRLLAATM
jgi:hypothetical protein